MRTFSTISTLKISVSDFCIRVNYETFIKSFGDFLNQSKRLIYFCISDPLSQGSNQLDSRFTLIAFDSKSNQAMIRKWVIHDSPPFDFWFGLIFNSQVHHDSPEWIKNKKNKKILIHLANQNHFFIFDSFRQIKFRESKWIDSVRALEL